MRTDDSRSAGITNPVGKGMDPNLRKKEDSRDQTTPRCCTVDLNFAGERISSVVVAMMGFPLGNGSSKLLMMMGFAVMVESAMVAFADSGEEEKW
ncbi:hypothetical protein ACLOJK_026278 [Asimina triloba]